MIEIVVTDKDGEHKTINDLYWFEENGVHDFEGEGHYGEKYTFEIYIGKNRVYPQDVTKCNCKCSDPGMWHDSGCPMRQFPDLNMWREVR